MKKAIKIMALRDASPADLLYWWAVLFHAVFTASICAIIIERFLF